MPHRRLDNSPSATRQRGLALYLLVFVLSVAAVSLFAAFLPSSAVRYASVAQDAALLAQSKAALVGWAVSRAASGERPGDLVRPDSFASTESPYNYDGNSDTGCMDATSGDGLPLIASGIDLRCFGRLPWRTLGMTVDNAPEHDPTGVMPWYAVSGNVVDPGCVTVLNSETANLTYPGGFGCGVTSQLQYPWLTVRDGRGNVISNRVAFVVIIPGAPVPGQSRPASPNLAGPGAYLDSVTVPAGCAAPCVPGTYSNADRDNDFIAGDPSDTFNDRLTFVTIDELMAEIEKRVASEVRAAIKAFRTSYTTYPWMAPFADPSLPVSYIAAAGSGRGLVPPNVVGYPFQAAFQWSVSDSPTYLLWGTTGSGDMNSGSVALADGSCTWESTGLRRVNCSGTIYDPEPGVRRRVVTIVYTGSTATYTVDTDPFATNLVVVPATATALTMRSVRRTNFSGVTLQILDYDSSDFLVGWGFLNGGDGKIRTWNIRVSPVFPQWYAENSWNQFVYAGVAPGHVPGGAGNCTAPGSCLAANLNGTGIAANVEAVVMTAGRTLASTDYLAAAGPPDPPQVRPNGNLYSYFDSANNVNGGTLIFDRKNPLTQNFNDQVVVVAP